MAEAASHSATKPSVDILVRDERVPVLVPVSLEPLPQEQILLTYAFM